jgi:hypothetical protein
VERSEFYLEATGCNGGCVVRRDVHIVRHVIGEARDVQDGDAEQRSSSRGSYLRHAAKVPICSLFSKLEKFCTLSDWSFSDSSRNDRCWD